jgi:hypothetical protein
MSDERNKAERHRHGKAWTGDEDGELLDAWEVVLVATVLLVPVMIAGLVWWALV